MTTKGSTPGGRSSGLSAHRHTIKAVLIALIFAAVGAFILVYRFTSTNIIDLERGDVAPRDVVAPDQIVYVSDIETEAAQERASNAVSTIYSPPLPKVARQQVNRLRKIFDYMETVRADPYASLAKKFEWIDAIPDLTLSDTIIDQILIMDDQDWAEMRQEALAILDEAMSAEIRESQVLATRRQLPTKVALDTPEQQSNVIVALTQDLIKPNTFPDEDRTQAERQAAMEAVEPILVTVEQNELIIPAGQVVGPRQLEALEALGLQQPEFSWIEDFVAPAVLMILTTVIISVYLVQYLPKLLRDTKRLGLTTFFVLAFIAIAKFMVPGDSLLIYLYPIAALAMMIAILINTQLAFILTTILAFIAGYLTSDAPNNVVIYLILSGWTGVLALGRNQRVNALLWAGVQVGVINTGVILIFNLSAGSSLEATNIGMLLLAGLLNGIFSAGLALIGLFAIGNLMGITTSIQLLDLGRPTQPLLRQLLLKAPGTYHHSLMVSNLAEQAAERIGADSLLVRVMAYYHDIGKMQRPYFFIENQPGGINVHEKLDPQISAQIIISHVTDGIDLARKYRLPQSIKDGIAQHHGVSLVKFFYYQAVEAAKESGDEVKESKFRYPGPKPQTRENGILMLADVSESTVRALKPGSAAEINEIVQKVVGHQLDTGQLDECDLTIADLHKIRTAFVDILQGVHHPRIKYPEQIKEEAKAAEEKAAQEQEKTPGQEQEDQPAEKPAQKTGSGVNPQPLKPASAASSSSQPASLVQRE